MLYYAQILAEISPNNFDTIKITAATFGELCQYLRRYHYVEFEFFIIKHNYYVSIAQYYTVFGAVKKGIKRGTHVFRLAASFFAYLDKIKMYSDVHHPLPFHAQIVPSTRFKHFFQKTPTYQKQLIIC